MNEPGAALVPAAVKAINATPKHKANATRTATKLDDLWLVDIADSFYCSRVIKRAKTVRARKHAAIDELIIYGFSL